MSGMDRDGDQFEPLHKRVADQIRGYIQAGEYAPGQRLQPEVELARQLGVSRGTLRHALRELSIQGFLQTLPGQGTFVAGASRGYAGGTALGLIGLVMPSIVRARNQDLVSGAEEMLSDHGYSLVLATTGDDRALETEQIQRIVSQGAVGLILYMVDGPPDIPEVRRLVGDGLPVVLIDRYVPDLHVDSVTMDNVGGAFMAVQHLVEQGHRRIGYIGTDNIGTSSIVERLAGYRWACAVNNLDVDDRLVCQALRRLLSWPIKERDVMHARFNQDVLRRYLQQEHRPTAVYVCNDYVAFQVVQAVGSAGLSVPEDIAVVGFDNVSYQDYYGVALTTVEQPRHEIGAVAASLLVERIQGKRDRTGRTIIPARLVVRRSSGVEVMGPTSPLSLPGIAAVVG